MTLPEHFQQLEREHLLTLRRLVAVCEALKPAPVSSLDPMVPICAQTELILSCLKVIIAKHSNDKVTSSHGTFNDIELLSNYNDFLFCSIKLLFSSETSSFRMGDHPEFAICIVKIYWRLLEFQKALNPRSTQMSSMINAFEYQFRSSYNIANCNLLRLDQVHDLLSHTYDLVSPPLINIKDIAKRDYFRLTLNKFNVSHQLVEIFQFSNGELAIFKVNSGELPSATSPKGRLLRLLSEGNYKLFNLGRTLLFPSFREYDLEVVSMLASGTQLKTPTGNNIILKLQCVDPLQWESHWKLSFQKLFDKKNIIPVVPQSISSASLAKSSHLFQSFKLKHNKLEDLRPASNEGLPIRIPVPSTSNHEIENPEIRKESSKRPSGLRRSEPLQRPLSTLMHIEEESETLAKKAIKLQSPSLKDIESFSFQKLIELDKTIQMVLSPVSLDASLTEEYKSVSQQSSLERIGPISERNIEESDAESAISVSENDACNSEEDIEEFSTFNPSAEDYKPTLYKRKSSSLLSLFSSKNKKGLVVDTASANASAASIVTSQSATPVSAKDKLPACNSKEDFTELPSFIDMKNDLAIFENDKVRITFWNDRQWEQIGVSSLQLSILRLENGEAVIVVYKEKEERQCKFVTRFSSDWKCNIATAQDIQVSIPSSDFVTSILPAGNRTFNIRCYQIEGLMNSLQHCTRGHLPILMPTSATRATLSSAPSSNFSNSVTRSSTAVSGITNLKNESEIINSLLLLSFVKIKYHTRVDGKGWQPKSIGYVDVYAQEFKGAVIAVKFEVFMDNQNNEHVTTFISQLHDIKRIGRTGLLLDKNADQLLEFTNKIIADQVYKLIKPL